MPGSISKLIGRMRYWCSTVSLGYSQSDRWNIKPGGNADCSSLVIFALKEAGFDTGGATYTGNLSAALVARGWRRLPVNGNPIAGDILLNDTHHVAVYLGNGKLAQASISEHGTAYGSGGDQTGAETNIANYYDYPWNCYLRYQTPSTTTIIDLTEETDFMKATHIIFQYKNALGVANILANTYHIYDSSQNYKDNVYALKRAGAKVVTWAALRNKKSNTVANPTAFGVSV